MAKQLVKAKPRALLQVSVDYLTAAETILAARDMNSAYSAKTVVRPSVNFLLNHAIELSLKAAIKALQGWVAEGHDLNQLYPQAEQLGLRVEQDPSQVDRNTCCLTALTRQNAGNAFRYFDGRNWNSVNAVAIQPFARAVYEAAEQAVLAHAPEPETPRRIQFLEPFWVLPGPPKPG